MKEKFKRLSIQAWVAIILAILAGATFVCGIIIPPPGEVHPSVLKGMGIITIIIALFFAWDAVDKGLDARFQHGETSLHITKPKNE